MIDKELKSRNHLLTDLLEHVVPNQVLRNRRIAVRSSYASSRHLARRRPSVKVFGDVSSVNVPLWHVRCSSPQHVRALRLLKERSPRSLPGSGRHHSGLKHCLHCSQDIRLLEVCILTGFQFENLHRDLSGSSHLDFFPIIFWQCDSEDCCRVINGMESSSRCPGTSASYRGQGAE